MQSKSKKYKFLSNRKLVFLLLLLVGIIIAWFSFKDEENLGSNYYFLPEYISTDIGTPFKSIIYKSQIKNSFENIVIHDSVIDVKSNSKYIIASQKSIVDQSINYYIIQKDIDKIYGPLNRSKFDKLRGDFKINLSFENH